MIDVHLHTKFSFDSEEEPENYIKKMGEFGVKTIGFSEHYDFDAFLDGEKDVTLADLDSYTDYISKLKKYNPELQILQGIEFGYRKEAVPQYSKLINQYPFDYVINSLHTLKSRGDCYHDKFFDGRGLKNSYADYLNGVLESVYAYNDYQIIGHIGYVCRYRTGSGSQFKYSDYSEIIDEILKAIIAKDKCLEINTSTGVSSCTFLPDKDIILRYIELGGKLISFGSDAHSADRFYRNAALLKDFLKQSGIKELYYYKNRHPVAYKI